MNNDCTVYVKLLGEGTEVYRPVPAVLSDGVYHLNAPQDYDPDDEFWEFPPGSKVFYRETWVGDRILYVASRLAEVGGQG